MIFALRGDGTNPHADRQFAKVLKSASRIGGLRCVGMMMVKENEGQDHALVARHNMHADCIEVVCSCGWVQSGVWGVGDDRDTIWPSVEGLRAIAERHRNEPGKPAVDLMRV